MKCIATVDNKIFDSNDESTLDEWRTRHSIDMSMRVLSIIINFINVFIYLFAVGITAYGFNNKNEYQSGIQYFIISFVIDMVYFFLIFIYYYFQS